MKTLSIQQPWASLVCSGIKDVENRTWKAAQVPGRILIHASSKKVSGNFLNTIPEEMESYITNNVFFGNLAPLDELPTSAIIGYVTVTGFDDGKVDSAWADGPGVYKWKLEDAWMFDEPILNVKGKLNLFDYDLDEDNLPPAHKVDLMTVELNDAKDEITIPCYDLPFKMLGEGNCNDFRIYLTDDLIDLFCTDDLDAVTMKAFKALHLVCGDRYKTFELTDDSAIYMIPDPQDESKPYTIMYHDGKEDPWLAADFFLGKKLDEGELVSICGGLKVDMTKDFRNMLEKDMKNASKENADQRIITLKVNKDTFDGVVKGDLGMINEGITSKNLSKFFVLDEKGAVKEIDGIAQLKPYDAIKLTNKTDSVTFQINNADVVYMDPEYNELTPYSDIEADDIDYTDCMIAYTLGEKVK